VAEKQTMQTQNLNIQSTPQSHIKRFICYISYINNFCWAFEKEMSTGYSNKKYLQRERKKEESLSKYCIINIRIAIQIFLDTNIYKALSIYVSIIHLFRIIKYNMMIAPSWLFILYRLALTRLNVKAKF
jgi:hypothetical protein